MNLSVTDHRLQRQLRRRDFLAYGAGLALLPSAAWAGRGRCDSLAVGYCGENPGLDVPETPTFVAAERLAAGEARLARRGARVTVHGLVGDVEGLRRQGIRSVDLRVRYASSEVEYRAWSWQLLPVENAGSPNAFTVPVDGGLELALELETFDLERFETRLSTGREPGEPKLKAGTYLIAPGSAEFRARRFDPAGLEPLIVLSVEPLEA